MSYWVTQRRALGTLACVSFAALPLALRSSREACCSAALRSTVRSRSAHLLRARITAVTIVAGRYRSGKSFLMNQLLGDRAGFSVGHTIASHTKGIWLCHEAVPAVTASGEKLSMLFMDSEGLGATDKVRRSRSLPRFSVIHWELISLRHEV